MVRLSTLADVDAEEEQLRHVRGNSDGVLTS